MPSQAWIDPMSLPMCCGFVRFSTNNGRTGNSNHPDKRILTERHRETPKVAGAFQYFTIKYICLFTFLHAIIICQLPSNVKLFPVFPADFPGFTFRAVFEWNILWIITKTISKIWKSHRNLILSSHTLAGDIGTAPLAAAQPQTIYGVVSLSAPMGQNSQNIQCHCEPVTDVTGVAIPRIGVKSKIS